MSRNNYLNVCFRGDLVGTLAMTPEHKVAFESFVKGARNRSKHFNTIRTPVYYRK